MIIIFQYYFNFSLWQSIFLQQWEGLIELLGSESKPAGGLEFLHKYEHPMLEFLYYFHVCI
jgi:hypothetical protein